MTLIDTDTTNRTDTSRVGSPAIPLAPRPRARAELVDQPVERLEAEVIELSGRLVLGTYERQPIDASPRRRFATRRQRRVLDERHPDCQHPGCSATAFLQYDHIQPYAQGGPTVIDNLQKRCGPHNRGRSRPPR